MKVEYNFTARLRQFQKVLRTTIKIRLLLPIGYYDRRILSFAVDAEWEQRIQDVLACPDNSKIDRVPNAGLVSKGRQVMHNGLKITLGGYYGSPIAQMLRINKGVHEPQEEYVFNTIINTLPDNAVIIELGAYWSFYSMTFLKGHCSRIAYLVEPDAINLLYGKNNFRINGFRGNFVNAFVSDKPDNSYNGGPKTVSVDEFRTSRQIDHVHILHADIQGNEFKMLEGSIASLRHKKISYLFISTHSNELHDACIAFLLKHDYSIVCEADLDESYSCDGLIVAKEKALPLQQIIISKKSQHAQKINNR